MAILSSSLGVALLLMVLETLLVTPTEMRPPTVTGMVLQARFGQSDKVASFPSEILEKLTRSNLKSTNSCAK